MNKVTDARVRPLSLEQLGVLKLPDVLSDDDEVLRAVQDALEMGFAGVILSGPPGTGKTVYASQIAQTLADSADAVRTVQFHSSYQYEDFMEGFVANASGGFDIQSKTFPKLCAQAEKNRKATHVLLIDEISRSDVVRVFGEALTYLEPDKRGVRFSLPSGRELTVPENLVILATMNPWDKGVDELDVALERRFAQVDMPPSAAALRAILLKKGADNAFVDRVVSFFEAVQALPDEMLHLGHAYFLNCTDTAHARRAWRFRLFPFFKRACRLDSATLKRISELWEAVVADPGPAQGNPIDNAPAPASTGDN